MSQAKKTRVRILNASYGCGHTSLAHARRYVSQGKAEWVGANIRFRESLPEPTETHVRHSASLPRPILRANPHTEFPDDQPSGDGRQSFLRYPYAGQTTSGPRFPALARAGAGLGPRIRGYAF